MTGAEVTPTHVTLTKEQIRWENQQENTQHSKLPRSVPRSVGQCYLLLAGDIATNAVKCVRWYMENPNRRGSDSMVIRMAGFAPQRMTDEAYAKRLTSEAAKSWRWLHQKSGGLTADDCFDAVGVSREDAVAELRRQFAESHPAELARLDRVAGLCNTEHVENL